MAKKRSSMKSFSPMTPEEKRERARAAYARDPEKYRALARENRCKPGAAERHKESAKDWALRYAYNRARRWSD
jgi:hypothetical protein